MTSPKFQPKNPHQNTPPPSPKVPKSFSRLGRCWSVSRSVLNLRKFSMWSWSWVVPTMCCRTYRGDGDGTECDTLFQLQSNCNVSFICKRRTRTSASFPPNFWSFEMHVLGLPKLEYKSHIGIHVPAFKTCCTGTFGNDFGQFAGMDLESKARFKSDICP